MNSNPADQKVNIITRIALLRLAVGLLGERDQSGWWASGFMSQTSSAFLAPVFGTRVLHARYQGVLEAARRVHDDRIGIGRVFHPFRLPETLEHRVFNAAGSGNLDLADAISSPESAWATLGKLEGKPVEAKSGPTLVGTAEMLDGPSWLADVASLYSVAFRARIQCFPYFKGIP